MKYYSQYNQDQFFNDNFFHNKRGGIFVDIGAYDGVEGSNTLFFEKELGWRGLCIEPHPKIFQKLQANRNCILSNAGAWTENTKKVFKVIDGYSEMLSGFVDCYDPRHADRIVAEMSANPQTYSDLDINCVDINELLFEHKLFHIDFLSIDIEGSEYNVLNHINFDLFQIDYITCENNYNDDKIRQMMASKGYTFAARLNIDDVYVRTPAIKQNKFKIVIPSYNNEEWVETNVESILEQTYQNYEVLYINDASTDNTLQLVTDMVGNNPKWKIVSNPKNRRRGYNTSPYNEDICNFMTNDSDILVFVDGDDWLAYPKSLERLNDFYNANNSWMTYGRFVCYTTLQLGNPQNTEYPTEVHNQNLYRRDHWRASHLRTFKWWLYKKIKKEDLIYSKTNDYYFHAEDLAATFPCLEMCPKDKIGIIPDVNYVFNDTPSNRARGVQREKDAGMELEMEIRTKIPYNKLIVK